MATCTGVKWNVNALITRLLHNERVLGPIMMGPSDEFVHPSLKVTLIEGKGRGLVAKDEIRLGELLMRISPLAWLKSESSTSDEENDQGPDPLGLVPLLMNGSPKTLSWLHALDSKGQKEQADALFGGTDQALPSPPSISSSTAESIVLGNAFGDRFQDPVHTRLSASHSPLAPFVGLWPHFSLINHSCTPNVVHYATSDGTLIVRASSDLRQGEEVTISYLGEEDFSPVAMRQDVLSRRFGFLCDCPRCKLEHSLPPSLTNLLHNIHKNIKTRLMPSFQAAVEEDDAVKLAALSSDLELQSNLLYEALNEFIRSDISRTFSEDSDVEPFLLLEAAIYELFQLIAIRDEISGADMTSSISSCLDILGAVSRGSEVECFLSARLFFSLLRRKKALKEAELADEDEEEKVGTRRDEGIDEAIQQAALACEMSHRARYGTLKKERLLQMMRLSDEVGREFL